MLGFGLGVVTKEDIKLRKYKDIDGNVHNNIFEEAIVVLKASSNKIRNLRKLAIEHKIKFVDFLDTMTLGTYEEEFEITRKKKDNELDYWTIVMLGPSELITQWTGKFSLYR